MPAADSVQNTGKSLLAVTKPGAEDEDEELLCNADEGAEADGAEADEGPNTPDDDDDEKGNLPSVAYWSCSIKLLSEKGP